MTEICPRCGHDKSAHYAMVDYLTGKLIIPKAVCCGETATCNCTYYNEEQK